jgi:hypothetical protein
MKTDQPNPTYTERAVALRQQSSVATLKKINQDYEAFLKSTTAISDSTIASANKAREIGIELQALCQHELMSESFWNANCRDKTAFGFDAAKAFISTARKMPKPAKTLQDAAPFIQTMLITADLLPEPERTEVQHLSSINPVQRFFNEFSMMRQPWQKITRTKPIEQWDSLSLKRVVSETEWVLEIRQKAEKLLKG